MTIYLRSCQCGTVFPGDLPACHSCGTPSESCLPAPVDQRDYVYDIETFANCFLYLARHVATGRDYFFEISDRVNQIDGFITHLTQLQQVGARMVGFNNIGFDYPVIHQIARAPWVSVHEIYLHAQSIIKSLNRWSHLIWESDWLVDQLDLFKMWHFDNVAKSTSLKALEFAMRSPNVSDLPYNPHTSLNDAQKDRLIAYLYDDVEETCKFYARSQTPLKLRESLSEKFGRNFVNMSNTKMGETILIMEMEKRGIECFDWSTGRKEKRQTKRESINLGECIAPYIRFEHPEFERIRAHLAAQTITETKGAFKELHCTINKLTYHFGTGGLHASVEPRIIRSDDEYVIRDVDVASFYPNEAIKNRVFPEHLGEAFCDAYESIYETRKTYPKKTPENLAYKEALNASYGNSNNEYSVLYDPKYTMTTTITGQLSLCMLAEQLIKIPRLQMLQCNTDGVTFLCPRQYIEHAEAVCTWWEGLTKLTLEHADYSTMAIRDVNNYIAVYTDGKVKRIGAYAYVRADENPGTTEKPYHKDTSALVVPKAAEALLLHGTPPEEFVPNHADDFDFMIRGKVPRSHELIMRWDGYDQEMPSIIRYYVAKSGAQVIARRPPTGPLGSWKRAAKVPDAEYERVLAEITGQPGELDSQGIPHDPRIHTKNKSKHTVRESNLCAGWLVADCSEARDFDRSNLNYDWYIAEVHKLTTTLLAGVE